MTTRRSFRRSSTTLIGSGSSGRICRPGRGKEVTPGPGTIEIVEFAEGKGVAFPITLFGTYLVALEKAREQE